MFDVQHFRPGRNGILIDDSIPANPGSLNSWLRKNDGYDKSNDFEENVLPNVTSSGKAYLA